MINLLMMLSSYFRITKYPTVEGSVYTIKNPWVILKKSGIIRLSDGQKISFSKTNKQEVLDVVRFALLNGIRFGNKPYQWKFDQNHGIIQTHQGIRFGIKKVGLLDEAFLSQIHFTDFDMTDKVVITAGAYIGDTPFFYSFYIQSKSYSI
ncbi:MAG: hypothetical protein QW778_04630 [Candidatus Micrarchaeaceae archaeon]